MLAGFFLGAFVVGLVASTTDEHHEEFYCRLWMAAGIATVFAFNCEIDMRELFAIGGAVVGGVLLLGVAGIAVTEYGTRMTAHYTPIHEQIRRDVFKNSEAHIEGTIRDLDNLRLEYLQSDDAHRDALAAVARTRLADVDEDTLPPRLQAWAHSLFTNR